MSVEIVLVNNELYSIRIVLVGFAKSTHAQARRVKACKKEKLLCKKKTYLMDLVIILPIRTLLFAIPPSNAIN